MNKLLYEQETYAIRGAVFEVYKTMGCGFLEAVYQECLAKEFRRTDVAFAAQKDRCFPWFDSNENLPVGVASLLRPARAAVSARDLAESVADP